MLLTHGNFPYGGASANLLRYFTIGLSRLGNNVEVILPTGNYYGQNIDHNKNKEGNIEGVRYKHLGFINHPRKLAGKLADNLCGIILPLIYLIKKAKCKEVDLIICYNVRLIKTLMLLLAKSVIRKKLILILPEFYEKPPKFASRLNSLKWYSFYFSMRYLMKYADGFVVLTYYLKNFVEKALHRPKPIIIMPNLIDPDKFSRTGIAPYLAQKTTIGYIGTPTRKDGVMDLIRSFSVLNKKYPDTHLLVIGDITNGKTLIPSLKQFVRSLNVENKVTFTGLVSHERVPELLHSCQILALTRPRGVFAQAGFPTKLGEYFACKKPVVITNIGDMPKYFTNEKHVMLVEAENIDSITKGFEKLLLDRDLMSRLPYNAYEWMCDNLAYKKAAKRIDRFLIGVLKA